MPNPGTLTNPHRPWPAFTGLMRCHEAMGRIEKSIIARVHRKVMGFSPSLMFGCDLIIAREDAVVATRIWRSASQSPMGARLGIVPGDGGWPQRPSSSRRRSSRST